MNKELYQKDEGFGIVTDENGALKIIQKDNNDYPFKEILDKENKLANLVSDYNSYNKCLRNEQLKRKIGWFCIIPFVISTVFGMGFLLIPILKQPIVVFEIVNLYMLYAFSFYYGIIDCSRKEKINNLYHKVKTSFEIINKLSWDIVNMKKKTKYKEVSSAFQDNIGHNMISFYNLEEANSPRKEKPKVKIIKYGYNDNKR